MKYWITQKKILIPSTKYREIKIVFWKIYYICLKIWCALFYLHKITLFKLVWDTLFAKRFLKDYIWWRDGYTFMAILFHTSTGYSGKEYNAICCLWHKRHQSNAWSIGILGLNLGISLAVHLIQLDCSINYFGGWSALSISFLSNRVL